MTSFSIEDILAKPSRQGESTPQPSALTREFELKFGVDSILSSRASDSTTCLTYCGQYQPFLPTSCTSYCCTSPLSSNTSLQRPYRPCFSPSPYGSFSNYGSYSPYIAYSSYADKRPEFYSGINSSLSNKPSQPPVPGQKLRKPRRPWTRAVFSNLQRKGLEKRFQVQKYLTKADRHQLASMLGLSDNQVKVWFQNRRMKWRQQSRECMSASSTEEQVELEHSEKLVEMPQDSVPEKDPLKEKELES